MKIYGNYTDHELNEWQTMPSVASVLTSSAFGAWLLRRDENKAKQEHSFEGMTNGEVIKKVFSNIDFNSKQNVLVSGNTIVVSVDIGVKWIELRFNMDWWDASYKGGAE